MKVIPIRAIKESRSQASDEQLVALCGLRDSDALAKLFDRHAADVYRFVACLSFADLRDVDDIVQDTFLGLYKSAHQFAGISSVKNWLFGIAVNVARHKARSEKRRRLFGLRYAALEARTSESVDQCAVRNQRAHRLGVELSRLSHDQRTAFVICEIEGVSGPEAAVMLNIPEGTLYRRLHDARKNLRRLLVET